MPAAGWIGSGINSDTNVQLTLTNSSFINNSALVLGQQRSGYGGGLNAAWVHGDQLFFKNNMVMNRGGGIRASEAVLTNSRLISNSAGYGGGIYNFHLQWR